MNTKYTFWKLLSDYKIEIPKIQRDYAQGRKDPNIKKIVNIFLEDIKDSIINNKELNLDFVYGQVENNVLTPLDGQQRLTTLFLIHWYIALKENKLTDEVRNTLSKFTYETRLSSQDFCKNLVNKSIDYSLIEDKISTIITDSEWYFLSWQLDPTVAGMLNILDSIHGKFKGISDELFEKLQEEQNITFNFLPLEQFKLTDELYIKMNARGKPLTEFENFKAHFVKYLNRIEDKSKLDNEWLDIFWNLEKDNDQNTEEITKNVDEKFFNFFKNITLNFYVETNNIDKDFIDNYNLFDIYKKVYEDQSHVESVIKILDALISYDDSQKFFKDFLFSSPTYWVRTRFYALSKFFIEYGNPEKPHEKDILKRWLRVTKNLINNTLIQSSDNYADAIRSLNSLSKHIADIYEFTSSSDEKIKYFPQLQRKEEKIKAKLILADAEWEKLFKDIEEHKYFDGQIGFILKYSKNDDGSFDKDKFMRYSKKLSELFPSELMKDKEDTINTEDIEKQVLFQRALLSKGDYLPQIGKNHSFCSFKEGLRAKVDNWRKVFNDDEKTLILKELLDCIDKDKIETSLREICDNHGVNDWRKYIIEDYKNIDDCKDSQIRFGKEKNKIYLLSRSQMNSYHSELFSRSLFKDKFKDKNFLPFLETTYIPSASYDEPYIRLSGFSYDDNSFFIKIFTEEEGIFGIKFINKNKKEIPKEIIEKLQPLGFAFGNNSQKTKMEITQPVKEEEIEAKIHEICKKLRELT